MENLSSTETEELNRISNSVAQRQFIISRAGIRLIVARYFRNSPEKVEICRSVEGKPWIAGKRGLEFSLSHSKGDVFAAFGCMPLGLDMEHKSRRVDALGLARRYYTEPEFLGLEAIPDAGERSAQFMRYWVCKEAMVKLAGEGLAHGLAHAVVTPDGRGFYRGVEVSLLEFETEEHFGAVAAFQNFDVKGWFVI